jgi:hypothetical protein
MGHGGVDSEHFISGLRIKEPIYMHCELIFRENLDMFHPIGPSVYVLRLLKRLAHLLRFHLHNLNNRFLIILFPLNAVVLSHSALNNRFN